MRKQLQLFYCICFIFTLCIGHITAQTVLNKGDIAIVAMKTDTSKEFAFVTFVDLDEGTIIYFTDEEANGTFTIPSPGFSEGVIQYTAPVGGVSAGTVISALADGTSPNFTVPGTAVSVPKMSFSSFGDAIIAYQGSAPTSTEISNVTTFLHSVGDAGRFGTFPDTPVDKTLLSGEFLPLTTTSGGDADDGNYIGAITVNSVANHFKAINDITNWETANSRLAFNPPGNFTIGEAPPSVGFGTVSSTVTETNATFTEMIPVTLADYDGNQVDLSITIDPSSTAEVEDYTLNTPSLSFTDNETHNISININSDTDQVDETLILNISETTSTGVIISKGKYTITILDNDVADVVITEIMYDNVFGGFPAPREDEWVELFNNSNFDADISDWVLEAGNATFTFPSNTIIPSKSYVTIAVASNGDGSFSNFAPFTPNFNSLGVANSVVASTSDGNYMNSSGTVEIKTIAGNLIDEVDYSQGDGLATAGRGPSFEIVNVNNNNEITNNGNWQVSAFNGGSPGRASSATWSGATDNNWVTASNWQSALPEATSSILIPSSLATYPTIGTDVTAHSVSIGSGGSLVVNQSASITGSVTYERNLATTNWYLISSPVIGQDVDAFAIASNIASGTGNNKGLGVKFHKIVESFYLKEI